MELKKVLEQLPEVNNQLQGWTDKVDEEFQKLFDWNAIPPGESSEPHISQALDLAQQRAGPRPEQDIDTFLDNLCLAYLQADTKQRKAIRAAVGDTEAILESLQGHIHGAGNRLRETKQPEYLRLALSAAAIEDNRRDYRDMYLTLGELYTAAIEAGIDPQPHFEEVAALATASMKRFLLGFHKSAYFKEDLKPRLHDLDPNRW